MAEPITQRTRELRRLDDGPVRAAWKNFDLAVGSLNAGIQNTRSEDDVWANTHEFCKARAAAAILELISAAQDAYTRVQTVELPFEKDGDQ